MKNVAAFCLLFAIASLTLGAQPAPQLQVEIQPDHSHLLRYEPAEGMALVQAVYQPGGNWLMVFSSETRYGSHEYWVARPNRPLEGPFDNEIKIAQTLTGRMAYAAKAINEADYGAWYIYEGTERLGPLAERDPITEYCPGLDIDEFGFSPDGTLLFYHINYDDSQLPSQVVIIGPDGRNSFTPNYNDWNFYDGHRYWYRYNVYKDQPTSDIGPPRLTPGQYLGNDRRQSGPWSALSDPEITPSGTDFLSKAQNADGSWWLCQSEADYGPFLAVADSVEFLSDGSTPRFLVREERPEGICWTLYAGADILAGPFPEPDGQLTFPGSTPPSETGEDAPGACWPRVSPDGQRIAFGMREGVKIYIQDATQRLGPFYQIHGIAYSADGSVLAGLVRSQQRELWLFGGGYRIGPLDFDGALSLAADGSWIQLRVREDYVGRVRDVRWSRGDLTPTEESTYDPTVQEWAGLEYLHDIPGYSIEAQDDQTYVRCPTGRYGPINDFYSYLPTVGGGFLYAQRTDERYVLFWNDQRLIDANIHNYNMYYHSFSFEEIYAGNAIVIMNGYPRRTADLYIAHCQAYGLLLYGEEPGELRYISLVVQP